MGINFRSRSCTRKDKCLFHLSCWSDPEKTHLSPISLLQINVLSITRPYSMKLKWCFDQHIILNFNILSNRLTLTSRISVTHKSVTFHCVGNSEYPIISPLLNCCHSQPWKGCMTAYTLIKYVLKLLHLHFAHVFKQVLQFEITQNDTK